MTPPPPSHRSPRPRREAPSPSSVPRVRRGTVRVAGDVATRLRAGHPFVFREALGGRPLQEAPGEPIEIVDLDGEFIARALYDADSIVAARVISRDVNERIDAEAIRRRVAAAERLRRLLPVGDGTLTAYRVLHAEGDGVPGVSVDRYGDFLVAHIFTSAIETLLPHVYDALEAQYHPTAIYEQRRLKPLSGDGPRPPATLVRGTLAPIEIDVVEGGLKFGIDVTAPTGTGLFLDLREGRRLVAERARGRRVLNLFSYTGGFSVYAAQAGATKVTSVDLAAKAHARARKNFALNGLDEKPHEFVAGDVFPVLARLTERKQEFDLVVVDPPPFGQSKGRAFSAQKDYSDLVAAILPVCARDGLLVCVCNTMKLDVGELDRAIGQAAARAGRVVRTIERRGLPSDFPVPAGFDDGHYLKLSLCAVI